MSRRATARATAAAGLLVAALAMLPGCAGILAAGTVVDLVGASPSAKPSRWIETNRLIVGYPAAEVFAALEQQVAKNGRAIVERDAEEHTLRVSYPFSFLANIWGGTIRITCVADAYGTTVTVLGDGRDAVQRVRLIGDEVLADLDAALRRLPRTL